MFTVTTSSAKRTRVWVRGHGTRLLLRKYVSAMRPSPLGMTVAFYPLMKRQQPRNVWKFTYFLHNNENYFTPGYKPTLNLLQVVSAQGLKPACYSLIVSKLCDKLPCIWLLPLEFELTELISIQQV